MPAPLHIKLSFQWPEPSHTSNRWLPTAWGHIDIAPPFFASMISVGVTPIPLASYGLGTHRYCFIHYHSKDLSCSHTHTISFLWPGKILLLYYRSKNLRRIPSASYCLGTHYCFIHYRSKDLSCSHTYTISFLWPGNTLLLHSLLFQEPQPQSHQWLILRQNPSQFSPTGHPRIHSIVNFPQVIVLHDIRVFVCPM